ncbi:DNA-binding protein [Sphingobacterium sp. SGG-5]|uniref:DNA-binding protein n=1 Tax=Sphingobacterium sp. SGG-5 TaxID=2710881 RepID=UPI0013EAFE9C|nr:DNA-binding protein [Sphingobacterium sp. SGG-5]NGM60341.1 DNA-binding protein [Sphingobacterium sp. SGG-5]
MLFKTILLLLFSLKASAQVFNAAPFLAMGNTGLAQGSLYSISNNPAGVASLESMAFGVAYQNHFFSSEIQSQAVFAALPFASSSTLAFGMNSYGLQGVANLLTLRGSYAKQFGRHFSSGISVNSHRYYVTNYENDNTLSLDLGFQYYANDDITIGALARNVTKAQHEDVVPAYIPVEFGIGFYYKLSTALRIAYDMYYGLYTSLDYRGGIEYAVDSRVVVRGGVASHPTQYFGGVGLVLNKLHVDIASAFHPRLGTSPQLAIAYDF